MARLTDEDKDNIQRAPDFSALCVIVQEIVDSHTVMEQSLSYDRGFDVGFMFAEGFNDASY